MIWLVIGYFVCVFICYGMLFSYTQKRFPAIAKECHRDDLCNSLLFGLIFGLFGPIGVAIVFLVTGFAQHGFKVK